MPRSDRPNRTAAAPARRNSNSLATAANPPRRRAPRRARKSHTAPKPKKLSRTFKPDELTLEEWQLELRRQHGREQDYELTNVGGEPYFSEFRVRNPQSRNVYRVSIRGLHPGDNYCSCPDFSTNAIGSCKHVEFTLARLLRKRGGAKALGAGWSPPFSEVWLQYGSERQVRFRAGTECPPELARLASRFFDDEGLLRPDAFAAFDEFLTEARTVDHELRLYDDATAFIAQSRDAVTRRERIARAFPKGIRSARWKKLLKAPLYDYQREGALFAAKAGRCLIGDEMGLGKTIQAIAAAEILAQELGIERVLVICPTSLKHQWQREIEKFAGRTAEVIAGPRMDRQKAFQSDAFFKITNYDTIHTDLDLIQAMSPDLVILDEAQRIKNWATRAANAVKKIDSSYCVVLTGTPLENRLEELVSIVQFIDRHRLGPTYRFLHDHQLKDDNGRVVGYRDLDQVGKTLEPILIRRQKKEVLTQLPPRLENNYFVPMTPQQQEYHDENRDTVARIVQKWRRYGFLTEADQTRLMICLQNMRMSCNSTYLIDKETDFSHKPDELMTVLGELLERPDSKAIVFSQWTGTHELSIRRFARNGIGHVFFHGGVESRKRKDLIDRFRNDPECRVFLSTDAGGVGLNLQFANTVVNMDLPWNPAVLEQRIGRAHRMGQTQPVNVVNFVAKGTIEEGMLSVLSFKKSLFAGALDGGDREVFLGGSRLTKFLESVESVTKRIPAGGETLAADADVPVARPNARSNGRRSEVSSNAATRPNVPETARATPGPTLIDPQAAPLQGLLQCGLELLSQLAMASTASETTAENTAAAIGSPTTIRDTSTGRTLLQIPLPAPETLNRALDAIRSLLENASR